MGMPTRRRNGNVHHYAARHTWSRDAIVAAVKHWHSEFGYPPRSYHWCAGSARNAGLVDHAETD